MKKVILMLTVLMSGLLLGGCGKIEKNTENIQQKLQENVVTKTGMITTKMGDEYLLSTGDGIVNLNSTKVDLEGYLKQEVTVKGMYSGSTLYVDEIE